MLQEEKDGAVQTRTGFDGPHRQTSGVSCEGTLEFLIGLRSMSVC